MTMSQRTMLLHAIFFQPGPLKTALQCREESVAQGLLPPEQSRGFAASQNEGFDTNGFDSTPQS